MSSDVELQHIKLKDRQLHPPPMSRSPDLLHPRRNSTHPVTPPIIQDPPHDSSETKPIGLLTFLSQLDMHGIASLMKADQLVLKAVWVLILLLATGIMIYGLVENARDYINNPVLTTYDIVAGDALEFPHIYLCPTNYINYTFVRENKVNMSWANYFVGGKNITKLGDDLDPSSLSLLTLKQSIWDRFGVIPMEPPPIVALNVTGYYENGTWHTYAPLPPMPSTTTTTVPPPLVYRNLQDFFLGIGYSREKFIRECSFQSEIIPCSNMVSEYFDRDNGKCFLVDVDSAQTKPGDGLSLVLDLNTRFFHDPTLNLKPSIFDGVYMMVKRKLNPAIADKILLLPGEYTRVGLDARRITRISGNHGGRMRYCRSDTKEFRVLNISEYTVGVCHMDCTQAEILDNCGCILAVDSRFIRKDIQEQLRSNVTDEDEPEDGFCTSSDMICAKNATTSKREAIQSCMKTCDPQCEEWTYTPSLSHMRFPSELTDFPWKSDYSLDYLIVDITFLELQYTNVIQSESMTAATFVSNIGGQMGVWMGASLLTMLEILLVAISSAINGRKSRS